MRIGYGYLTAQHHPDDVRTDVEIYREAIDIAVELEAGGIDSIWTSEHHFVDDGYMPSQLPVLAAIAARTTRVLREVERVEHRREKDAATVDLISDGRLILGLGIGWRAEEFDGFGVPAGDRGARLEATIAVLRQAWSDALVTGDGRYFRYDGLNVTPKPAGIGGPPIFIGAGAEAAVRRVGRVADGYLAGPAMPERLAERIRWAREEAESVGRDPMSISANLYRPTFAWRDGDAWERVRESAWYIDWKYGDMGDARGSRERRRPPAMGADDEARVRRMANVGTPEQVVEEILRYRDVLGDDGTYVARAHFPGMDPGVAAESRRILLEEVLPAVRG
jgi:alkanesulfonate monooxygenase SsuD/methylene tetrahydromethanopterin reductase-like flavin-dependent oxidoreductase (luciferase family)